MAQQTTQAAGSGHNEEIKAAMELAAEAIEQLIACHNEPDCPAIDVGREAVAALQKAIAQVAKGE